MAETLPYIMSTGLIPKILDKIKEAATPERFSQDYLGTVLGYSGGSAKPFIPLAKRLGFLNSDGSPSDIYKAFRGSDDQSRAAMATAIRIGYAPLYRRNEYAEKLERKKLEGLIKEITGAQSGSSTLKATIGTFEALKQYASFESQAAQGATAPEEAVVDAPEDVSVDVQPSRLDSSAGVRFGYTININLPNTNDIAVFNAIFKSLKEHLL